MSWQKIRKHNVPYWVIRRKRNHVRGRTYLYARKNGVWHKKLKSEWDYNVRPWEYIAVGFVSTLLAALISGIVLYWVFG